MPNSRSSRSRRAARWAGGAALFALTAACGGQRGGLAARPSPAASAPPTSSSAQPPGAAAALPAAEGDVQDILASRLISSPVFHVHTHEGCKPLEFRPAIEDGSAGSATFRGSSFEYWIECGFLAFRHLPRDRVALRGATSVSILAGASELFFDAASCARFGPRGAPLVLDRGAVSPEANDASRAPVIDSAYEPSREYLAYEGTLHWPVMTHGGVVCHPQRLRGDSGDAILPGSQDMHPHRFTQDALRIVLQAERGVTRYPSPGEKAGARLLSIHPRALPVHGRDASSFFVEGSRWFFRAQDCEAAKGQARPIELNFVRSLAGHLAEQPQAKGPREPLPEPVDLNARYRIPADPRATACESITVSTRPTAYIDGPRRGLIVAERPGFLERFEYEYYWDPRSVWVRRIEAGRGRLSGELRGVDFVGNDRQDVRVGREIWYARRAACEAARSR